MKTLTRLLLPIVALVLAGCSGINSEICTFLHSIKHT